jgi:hypothetical protein
MTTKVTVDAHAGWPVKVITVNPKDGIVRGQPVIVPPNTEQIFYVHSEIELIIHEVQPDE